MSTNQKRVLPEHKSWATLWSASHPPMGLWVAGDGSEGCLLEVEHKVSRARQTPSYHELWSGPDLSLFLSSSEQ